MQNVIEHRKEVAHVIDGENWIQHLTLFAVVLACRGINEIEMNATID